MRHPAHLTHRGGTCSRRDGYTPMPGSKRLIIAFFENPAAAEVAARAMERRLAVTERQVDGVVGLLSLDPTGRPITAKLGRRVGEDGPGVGAVLGVIATALQA